ncbi:Lrp/AsnC family transcriptional regulator [Methyloraptor flagellatus]|uniref:Lrp/AsnC family transcriptional regulator n=1 Tax=Methyloraptor flagellatus TaxID=3162530 RepID=A0AAU7XDQ1_9HYPH
MTKFPTVPDRPNRDRAGSGPVTLDRADRILLGRMQANARVTIEALAAEAGLSPSSAQRRLARLRAEGVIAREAAELDPRRLGLGVTLVVDLEVDGDRPELIAPLHASLMRADEVQSAWQVTGSADYVLVVVCASVEAFDGFITGLMERHPNLRKYTTRVALKTLKHSLRLPVADAD